MSINEQAEHLLMAKCPWCKYTLRGLPTECLCPECGLELDRTWTLFRGISSRSLVLFGFPVRYLLITGVVCFAILPLALFILRGPGYDALAGLVIGWPLSLLTWRALRRRRKGIVLVTPHGWRVVFHPTTHIENYDWHETHRVKIDSICGEIIVTPKPKTVPQNLDQFGWNTIEADKHVREHQLHEKIQDRHN